MMNIDRITVLGMGMLGRGIVERLTSAGLLVRGYDSSAKRLQTSKRWLQEMRSLLVSTGLIESERKGTAIRLTNLTLSIDDAMAGVHLIIDATDDFEDSERDTIYKNIAENCPEDTVICLDAELTDIHSLPEPLQSRASNILGLRWNQPVSTLHRAVIEQTAATDESVVDEIKKILTKAGITVVSSADGASFDAVGRLRMALLREALALLEEGKLDAAAIDDAARNVIGPQVAAAGIFGYMSAMGAGRIRSWLKRDLPKLSSSNDVPGLLKAKLEEGSTTFIDIDPQDEKGLRSFERVIARMFMVINPQQ